MTQETGVLGIPARRRTTQRPFWHRSRPLVAVAGIDEAGTQLREVLPASWRHLIKAKECMDAVAAISEDACGSVAEHRRLRSPLLGAVAEELERVAALETGALAQCADMSARRIREHLASESGEWPELQLIPPGPEEPWLYCGPLNTWAGRVVREPLALLVARPVPSLQAAVDAVDTRLPVVQFEVERVLGAPVTMTEVLLPTMRITDLLLAGGDFVAGHKNFAHFFPLESPGCSVVGEDFTVAFANVHAERLKRCSFPLLGKFSAAEAGGVRPEGSLAASLQWFRCHDLAHFWRAADSGSGSPLPSLTPFERIALEECYADTLGLLSAAAVSSSADLAEVFTAEMLRYLSRDASTTLRVSTPSRQWAAARQRRPDVSSGRQADRCAQCVRGGLDVALRNLWPRLSARVGRRVWTEACGRRIAAS